MNCEELKEILSDASAEQLSAILDVVLAEAVFKCSEKDLQRVLVKYDMWVLT